MDCDDESHEKILADCDADRFRNRKFFDDESCDSSGEADANFNRVGSWV